MNRFFLICLAALLLASLQKAGAQQSSAQIEKQLARAHHKATVDGDLAGAIDEYKRIVATAGSNRNTAAQTLVRMAECYQKLGDAESTRIYERLVREYPDQADVVLIARARLDGNTMTASARGDRPVWTGPLVSASGRISPDGRFIAARDRRTGGLLLRDVTTNADRTLTPPPGSYYGEWTSHAAFSSDAKRIVYEWHDSKSNYRLAFRIAAVPKTGLLEPRQFFLEPEDTRAGDLTSFDWSPDGKWIAAAVRRADRTGQIALISVDDGSSRVLRSMDWNVPEEVFFSTDSKYIAYDLPAGDGSAQRDVFVLAIDGSQEIAAVVHGANDGVLGWSPDGSRLLFSSDRTGSWGLWSVRFADGKVQGTPELLKSDIGRSFEGKTQSLGITRSGTLYVHKRFSSRDVAIAPLDLTAGQFLGPPVSFTEGTIAGARNPVWSPDGKYLAYPTEDSTGIAIRSIATGHVRLLPRTISYAQALLDWSPDGRSVLTRGTDLKGRTALMQLDVQSGAVTPIEIRQGDDYAGFAQWSPDGTKIYFNRFQVIYERDMESGAEREIQRGLGNMGPLSPDGRYLTVLGQNAVTRSPVLRLIPVAGGEPRELLRLSEPERFMDRRQAREVWTPDGSAVIVVKNTGSHLEMWRLPIDGGEPRKLDIDPNLWRQGSIGVENQGFSLSPDGRSIAFVMGKGADEVWALENFLPATPAKK